jgi:hypothetical protein
VTECTGGARGLVDADFTRAYKSSADPRLNYEQSLELAVLIVRKSGGASAPDHGVPLLRGVAGLAPAEPAFAGVAAVVAAAGIGIVASSITVG